jgi:hypothetical protein
LQGNNRVVGEFGQSAQMVRKVQKAIGVLLNIQDKAR